MALRLGFALFSLGLVGGGDAKLFAASCLWLGPQAISPYALYAALIGGALALLLLFWRAQPLPPCLPRKAGSSGCTARTRACPMASRSRQQGLLAYHGPFMAALGG